MPVCRLPQRSGIAPSTKSPAPNIADWVAALVKAGKSASTVRHHYFVLRIILSQSTADNRIMVNPAVHVKLPNERSATGGSPGVVDDPNQFVTALQVSALVDATPWPFDVYVHLAAWSGLRAGELAGLQVDDVPQTFQQTPLKPGQRHESVTD